MRLHPGEPAFGPWQPMSVTEAVDKAIRAWPANRLATLAVDGGSSSGKTTLGERIVAAIAGAVVVHTDDVAWWQSVFDWVDLLVEGILEPALRGEAVTYRPPAWDRRQRAGAISVPAGARLLIVEGVGAGRRELARYLDGVI